MLLTGLLSFCMAAAEPTEAAAWELRALGVDTPPKLAELRASPKHRAVKLAIVGQSGVSAEAMKALLADGNTLVYHGCADPKSGTHDTGQAPVILEITRALGVAVELHVWQPGESDADVARCFAEAGKLADIVVTYQSFWGPDARLITQAIRESSSALFISPYGEYENRPTGESPQGSAHKPWDTGSIPHFVTAAPLARRLSKGDILAPLDRGPADTEAINFIAPSHHANGPGGTCPAAGTTAACAAYLYAVLRDKPSPVAVIERLRSSSTIDRRALKLAPEFDDAAVDMVEKRVKALREPPAGRQRKLDAPGVLNLYQAYAGVAASAGTRPATQAGLR